MVLAALNVRSILFPSPGLVVADSVDATEGAVVPAGAVPNGAMARL